MKLTPEVLPELASRLKAERKRQGLSRIQAASVCGVSPSFIRDAESNPGPCSLQKLLLLATGLGLEANLGGWQSAETAPSQGLAQ